MHGMYRPYGYKLHLKAIWLTLIVTLVDSVRLWSQSVDHPRPSELIEMSGDEDLTQFNSITYIYLKLINQNTLV